MGPEHAGILMAELLYQAATNENVTLGKLDSYGQRYDLIFPMTGPNGNTRDVLSSWIVDPGANTPRLITCYAE